MAGPIQTAIGQALGAVAGVAAIGKKISDDKRQAAEEKSTEEAKTAKEAAVAEKAAKDQAAKEQEQRTIAQTQALEKQQQEEREASAVATEADLRSLGASPEAARAYRLAQQRGTASPHRIIFDESGKPLATYSEMASILADESLSDLYSSKLRTKEAVKTRKELLEGRTHKERVEDAILSILGGLKNGK